MMLRGGSYACVISGMTLVLLAMVVTYALGSVMGGKSMLRNQPTLRASLSHDTTAGTSELPHR